MREERRAGVLLILSRGRRRASPRGAAGDELTASNFKGSRGGRRPGEDDEAVLGLLVYGWATEEMHGRQGEGRGNWAAA